ncbi:putative Interleukin enhancer-binding factor 2-like protein [Hypsibius exemplaris]|uniref:Interleukin enhancer-binding factor 2-like protein n=1 Tax=Hypsibius exemplaris TaxID=2072580 RepID=A0A1W0WCS3_HYPEX|nr:putative Interleukin enhancer-binding factor 2-like protein [Hypsibius exemplaris]
MFPSSDLYQIAPGEYQRQTVLLDATTATAAEFTAESFKQAVFQRLFAITVPARSKDAVQSFISKLQTVLEGIILQNQGGMFTDCLIDHVNLVGQYQKDVAIAGPRELYSDVVVTLTSVPTVSSVQLLGAKIVSDLMKNYPGEEYQYALTDHQLKIASAHAFISVHITVTPENPIHFQEVPESTGDSIPLEVLEDSQRLIDEADWFAANASTTSIKGLVRLLSDLRERFPPLRILKDPAIDLLAHYCVSDYHEGSAMPIELAFRRFLEFISMGVLLRDAYPASDVLASDVDAAAKIAVTRQTTDLLCAIGQGHFASVLSV